MSHHSPAPHLAVAIVSGGLDSVTLAHLLHSQEYSLHLLAFDYGQRHARELEFARACADRLHAGFDRVDLTGLRPLLKGSALTDDIAVPHGAYADASLAVTVVPNRNAILLAVAYAAAVAQRAQLVATGVHAGDHPVYPDCRPAFITAFEAMQRVAVAGYGDPDLRLEAPFMDQSKADIVRLGAELGVPFEQTWSCYEGGAMHCGQCATCLERRAAFAEAGVPDPTEYTA
jgi:7-cyano-7-deazaguanine synthase